MTNVLEFWKDYGPVITGGAVVISAICAFSVIFANRAIQRRRATLDLILHIESDGDLLKARKKLIEVKKTNIRSDIYGTEDKRDSDEAQAIRTVLNIHEIVAVSINEGVIDERVFRKWFNKAFIDDYRYLLGYIHGVRSRLKNEATFKELETLAPKWEDDKTWYDKPGLWRRKASAFRKMLRA